MTRTNQRDSNTSGGKPDLLPGRDHTAAQSKEAGALVYLQEELGDARMRCDQLLRYVDKAVQLVEKSSHKDHFFEVAGDVIRGIPETVFKLHKALEAVALAANRIDYEEIKQDLRPEKVEELERVLKDVRVRQVQRRSQPMVNPASVVEQLNSLAKKAREGGHLDTEGLTALIASLEAGAPKVAEDTGAKVASQLEAVAHALQNPPEGEMPSRYRLAQVLRKTLGEQLHVRTAAKPPEGAVEDIQAAVEALKKLARGTGNPKLLLVSVLSDLALAVQKMGQDEGISNLLERTAAVVKSKWSVKDLKDAGKGETPKTAAEDEKRSRYEEGKPADPTENMSQEDAEEWKDNTDEHKDKFKSANVHAQPRDTKVVEGILDQLVTDARLVHTTGAQGNYPKMFFNIMKVLNDVYAITNNFDIEGTGFLMRVTKALMPYSGARPTTNFASEDAKRSRFEEGKPADPTKHMDPEDAKAWKENTDKYEDKFTKEAGKPSEDASFELDTAVYGVKQLLRGAGNPKRVLFSIVTSLSNAVSHMGQDDRIATALWKAAMTINQSFSATDMREYSDAKEVTAADEEKLSRFEEGKPADPTKDMDPEDAKAWKENTDKYQDKFTKEAGVEDNLPLLNRLVDQVAEAAKQLKHSVGLVERDPRKYQPQVSNIQNTVSSLATLLRAVERKVFDSRTASYGKEAIRVVPVSRPKNPKILDAIWDAAIGGEEIVEAWRKRQTVPSSADFAGLYEDLAKKKWVDRALLAEFKKHLESYRIKVSSEFSWKAV